MNICIKCGCKDKGKNCPDCGEILREIYSQATIREKENIPGIGPCEIAYSLEAIQDMKMLNAFMKTMSSEPTEEEITLWNQLNENHYFGKILTPEPTEEEIKDWKHYDKLFAGLDRAAVKEKYKVILLREDEPYSWIMVDHADYRDAQRYNGGDPLEWMINTFQFEILWANLKESCDELDRRNGHWKRPG